MKAFRDFDYTNNQWNTNSTYDQSYESTFAYDKNGNITSLNRNGAATTLASSLGNNMDQLSYIYNDNGGSITTNKLIGVADAISGAPYTTDIQGGSSAAVGSPGTFDYDYDEIGNLIKNTKEYIAEIKWTVDREVAAIIRNPGPMFAAGKNLPDIYYEYDANRQRVVKVEKPILNNGTTYPYLKENNWKTTYYVRDASSNIMATYSTKFTLSSGTVYNYVISADEFDLYGAGRLGTRPAGFLPATIGTGAYDNSTNVYTPNTAPGPVNMPSFGWIHQAGTASYELSNHLGNVLTVISDRKVGVDNNADNIFDWYLADITETHDYYPFGYEMPGRTVNSNNRFTFNGKEDDKSSGWQTQDYGMRQYDYRLGRFISQDPMSPSFAYMTPYQFASNRPIDGVDLDGLEYVRADLVVKNGVTAKRIFKNKPTVISNGIEYINIGMHMYINAQTQKTHYTMSPEPPDNSGNWKELSEWVYTDIDIFKKKGWHSYQESNCFGACLSTLKDFNFTRKENSTIIKVVKDDGTIDESQGTKGIEFINKELEAGRPVMISIDGNPDKKVSENYDTRVDHWVTIGSRYVDEETGENRFGFYENGVNKPFESWGTDKTKNYFTVTGSWMEGHSVVLRKWTQFNPFGTLGTRKIGQTKNKSKGGSRPSF